MCRWQTGSKAAAVHRAVPDQMWSLTRQQASMREKYLRKSDQTNALFQDFDQAVGELAGYCRLKPDLRYDGVQPNNP